MRRKTHPNSLKIALASTLSLLFAACATAPPQAPPIAKPTDTLYSNPAHTGVRFGVHIADLQGNTLLSERADERFMPASVTKLITTAAAFDARAELSTQANGTGLSAYLATEIGQTTPSLVVRGSGDAGIGDGPLCETRCLSGLVDQIAATGLTSLYRVIGDETALPKEGWSPGIAYEDMQYGFGTAVSALSVNDNLLVYEVDPKSTPVAKWLPGNDFFSIDASGLELKAGDAERVIRMERPPGSEHVRLYGTLPMSSGPTRRTVGVDDPAKLTAIRIHRYLEQRGLAIDSPPVTSNRSLSLNDLSETPVLTRNTASTQLELAYLPATPLIDTLTRINKSSHNLSADLILRRLGLLQGTGSREHGLLVLSDLLSQAGASGKAYNFSDGSGLSAYNRITPRAVTQLLSFAHDQSWGEEFRATLPIGGTDGSLRRRFKGSTLEGRIFAKTGTLTGVTALGGYMRAKSGRLLVFCVIANDRPQDSPQPILEIDQFLISAADRF